ncbi:MAG: cell division protein FtsL [Acidobacteria bacterium]|uniref:Cell division protein FtsL n=1 Tax=Candidatus Polarisedimenticola svalbardensis TaxID=2886004 RepID=A0A8J6Y645_9BACT|nr:cell division protein FtsL [Candidatus Polarisedimenticola svalbardensis]
MSRQEQTTRRWKNVDLRLETDPRRNVKLVMVLLAIAAALAPLVMYVVQQNRYTKTRYQIQEAQNEFDRLVEEEGRFLIEKASMQNFQRVERAAPRIGLRQTEPDKVVWARTGQDQSGERLAKADQ